MFVCLNCIYILILSCLFTCLLNLKFLCLLDFSEVLALEHCSNILQPSKHWFKVYLFLFTSNTANFTAGLVYMPEAVFITALRT